MTDGWAGFSDGELRARLAQRGLPEPVVDRLVSLRDEHEGQQLISEVLE